MNEDRRSLYATVWRWHFYAGLVTAPVLALLASTGLVMLFASQIERWQFPHLARSGPPTAASTHQARLDAALAALPGARFARYSPGAVPGEPTRVEMELAGVSHTVYVEEADGRVLGQVPTGRRLGALAEKIHGTLLLGDFGDRLVETTAGFGVLLIGSGLFLWWPRRGPRRQALDAVPLRQSLRSRPFWRGLHRRVGLVLAPVLLLYLLSGLAWTGVWGGRFVQAWSTFPAEKQGPASKGHDHGSLNGGGRKAVPWNLEHAPLPAAPPAPRAGGLLSLDEAVAAARRVGIGPRFWAGIPEGRDDVWTVAQTGLSGEVTDPRDELTVHVDRRTGRVLGRVGWSDYGLGARAMAAGIPLHMGHLGRWNTAGAAAVCLLVLLLAVSGPLMWWMRRPARSSRLSAPPAPPRVPRAAWAALLLLSLAFPLTMIAILAAVVGDRLLVRWLPRLRAALD